MGKQGRKKQRQKRKPNPTNDSSEDAREPVNPSSAIHQLRHPDPKMRQNALIALQATVLHSSSNNKRVSVAVLQAVREQVMDANLECASAAAECLAQYLSSAANAAIEHQAVTTASWTPVLIARLDQCLKAIQTKADDKLKVWYALAAPCARALCKLVEMNERALEAIMTSSVDSYLSTILGLLHVVTTFELTTDIRFNEWVEEAAVYAARTLHSSLDENPELAERIHAAQEDATVGNTNTAWSELLTKLPNLAKLHICGSLVTMYQMVPAPWLSSLLSQHVLLCLSTNLVLQPDRLASLEQEYATAVALRKTQQEDEELEGEIVRKIQDRNEPARIIARRQKEVDRGSKAVITEEDTKDGEQAMDDALVAWSGVILPLQVTLEVTTNLLSCFIKDEDAMDQDGRGHDFVTHNALVSARMAESLVKLLQSLCVYQSSRNEVPKEHEALSDDLQETISKSAACLANCTLSHLLENANFESAWQVLRPYANLKGMSSILVVLAQQGLAISDQDTSVIQQLLHSSTGECQRDGVCLLAIYLNSPMHDGTQRSTSAVAEGAGELVRLLKQGESLAKIEALNAIMDLWGQDDFYPQIFGSQQILPAFQAALASLSTNKTLDAESEEVLFNSSRFVDYKLGR